MRKILGILLLAWAVAFVGSFIVFWLAPAKWPGLQAGIDRITIFFGWQAVATVLAFACLTVRWSTSHTWMRRLAAVPAIAVSVLMSALAVLFFWASVQRTAPDAAPPSKPATVTVPVTDS